MSAYEILDALGITLPGPTVPVAAFVPWVRTGGLLFVSGHVAKKNGRPWVGRLGDDKVMVLVNSAPAFTEQHLVANGASELFRDVLGPAGPHARSAVGVAQIPFGSCVEIEVVAQVTRE